MNDSRPFRTFRGRLVAAVLTLAWALPALGLPRVAPAQDFSGVSIAAHKITDSIYMLAGSGGNMGLFFGADGAFLIDDQYAPLTPKIKAAVARLTDQPIRLVLNTHWHGDHVGGNENLARDGALIMAHENVRRRMSTRQVMKTFNRTVPPAPPAALPILTVSDSLTLHINGDEVQAFHPGPAHTDGDLVVQFKKADVIHMGDIFFNGIYPFIDVSAGGSIDGMIRAVEQILPRIGEETRIIPGHGPLGDRAALSEYLEMLRAVRDEVRALVDAGKSREEVIAAEPTRRFDARWGNGFLAPDRWVGIVYDGMAEEDG